MPAEHARVVDAIRSRELVTALQQLARIATYADKLLGQAEPDAEVFVSAAAVGSDLVALLSDGGMVAIGGRQVAMLELSFWSLRNAAEVGSESLAAMLMSELVSLYMDQGKSRDSFVGAVNGAWLEVKNTRRALGAPVGSRSEG